MARLAVALTVFAAGATAVALHHDRPVPSPSAVAAPGAQPRLEKRASRYQRRHSLHVPQPSRWLWQRWLDVTGYCATGNPTASGVMPQLGDAATLDRSVPFGSHLHIVGYGDVTVTDRIGWGSDVDIYMGEGAACEVDATHWGRRHLLVELAR